MLTKKRIRKPCIAINLMGIKIILLCCLCTGCNLNAGLGIHNNALDGDNFSAETILGVIRASHQLDNNIEIYGEHISQKGNDSGRGLNHVGATIKIW